MILYGGGFVSSERGLLQQLERLNQSLLEDLPHYQRQAKEYPMTEDAQRQLFRSLMNVRPPLPLKASFLKEQDVFLREECKRKGIIRADELPTVNNSQLILWQGDITRLDAQAIVNAANSALLGCFYPCHGCIDNAIHSAAGLQLRAACHQLMQEQGHEEGVGQAKLTPAYNLPSAYVIHTVGPMVQGELKDEQCLELKHCYQSCLELAIDRAFKSLAFCCISTGEYRFPNREAAQIATSTVQEILTQRSSDIRVIFNVFTDLDWEIYHELLYAN